ncbi:hypothetical protein HerbRD11066_68990 [Herbidospora sp. RD11066]
MAWDCVAWRTSPIAGAAIDMIPPVISVAATAAHKAPLAEEDPIVSR